MFGRKDGIDAKVGEIIMSRLLTAVCVGGTFMWLSAYAMAQDATTRPDATTQPAAAIEPAHWEKSTVTANGSADLTSLSLEDLMNVQVTSVSKQSQKIADAPSAIFVIS
jgi:hypothetical protein